MANQNGTELETHEWPTLVRSVSISILKGIVELKSLDYVLVHSETAYLFTYFLSRISKVHYLHYYQESLKLWDSENFSGSLKALYENYLDRKLPSSRKVEIRAVTPSQKTGIKNFITTGDQTLIGAVKDTVLKLQEGVRSHLEDIVRRGFSQEILRFL
ncbi:uncharacterized protein LOC136042017 isoform X2 [Artemia franciscana]|uniref:Uncharacterized protein n=2 Tax=Artemia franciscana TaxID=6661 RepID=A0AA88HR63_ARTSF|nr:hypothetical protein QYM36_010224 [Artemia franciscana]KAK2715568.1 hypothetical protein QYM36_010224 [Artemia franciscana]